MARELQIDMTEWNAAWKMYVKLNERSLAELANHRAGHVSYVAMKMTNPQNIQVPNKKAAIRSYLDQQLAQYVRLAGRKVQAGAGKFRPAKAKSRQLRRVHLIVQAKRRKQGKKGLYGSAMKAAAGQFRRNAQKSVGYLKLSWVKIIKYFNGINRVKWPYFKHTRQLSKWTAQIKRSKGERAVNGKKPKAILSYALKLNGPNQAYAESILTRAMRLAIKADVADMNKYIRRKLQKEADRFKGR